jgi:polysaccharide deacetylase family protein (PEP-CTERM system associated)
MSKRLNMMTVDVEDWFHILESEDAPLRSEWDRLPSRVEENTDRLLELLRETNTQATFFVVGWVAERFPSIVRRIAEAGHEIGSHSYWHEVIRRYDRRSLVADLQASRKLLEDLSGLRVEGYRAPGNSITPADAWVFDVILEAGFTYDASVCPGTSSHGGFRAAYKMPHIVRCNAGDLIEIPSATMGIRGIRVPYAGGGYLRLFPYRFLKAAIGIDNSAGYPTNVYVHPREVDVKQPRMELTSSLRRFKYYVGLHSTERKLRRMLTEFQWVGIRRWIAERRPDLIGRVLDVRDLARQTTPHPDPSLIPPVPPIEAIRGRTLGW